jgi:hypothetical protein
LLDDLVDHFTAAGREYVAFKLVATAFDPFDRPLDSGERIAVRSRVFAAQDGAAHAAFSAAMLAGGVLVGVSGPRLATLTAAGCALAATLVASRMLARGEIRT